MQFQIADHALFTLRNDFHWKCQFTSMGFTLITLTTLMVLRNYREMVHILLEKYLLHLQYLPELAIV